MTTRSRINLLAAATIVAGGIMLAGARPAEAAVFGTGCQRMAKMMLMQSAECEAGGMTYNATGYCSDTTGEYGLISWCE